MPLVSMAQALADLEPHLPAFFDIPKGAWDDYHAKISEECQLIFNLTVRANAVHAFMIERASKYAEASGGKVKLIKHRQMWLLLIGTYAIRLKKLSEESLSKNIPTQQVRHFRSHQEFPEFPKTNHLEVGYVLDDAQLSFQEVRLVSPSGQNKTWDCPIAATGAKPVVVVGLFDTVEEEAEAEVLLRDTVVPIRKVDEDKR